MTKVFEGVGFVIGEVLTYFMTQSYLDCVNAQISPVREFLPPCPNPNGLAIWMAEGIWQFFIGYLAVGVAFGAVGGGIGWILGKLDSSD
jgi:hypothetical protein